MFKSFLVYVLPSEYSLNVATLTNELDKHTITPLSGTQEQKYGWAKIASNQEGPLLKFDGDFYIRVEQRYRKVPKSTWNSVTNQKLESLAEKEPEKWGPGAKVSKEMKEDVKAAVYAQLLEKSFTQIKNYMALYLSKHKLFIVGTATESVAEEVIGLMRATLGSFPAIPLKSNKPIEQIFSTWFAGTDIPASFKIENGDIVLKDRTTKKNVVKYSHQDLTSEEINANLAAYKIPQLLHINWNDNLEFSLNIDCKFSKIKRVGEYAEKIKQDKEVKTEGDDKEKQANMNIESDAVLMSLSLNMMLDEFSQAVGGFKRSVTATDDNNEQASELIQQFESSAEQTMA